MAFRYRASVMLATLLARMMLAAKLRIRARMPGFLLGPDRRASPMRDITRIVVPVFNPPVCPGMAAAGGVGRRTRRSTRGRRFRVAKFQRPVAAVAFRGRRRWTRNRRYFNNLRLPHSVSRKWVPASKTTTRWRVLVSRHAQAFRMVSWRSSGSRSSHSRCTSPKRVGWLAFTWVIQAHAPLQRRVRRFFLTHAVASTVTTLLASPSSPSRRWTAGISLRGIVVDLEYWPRSQGSIGGEVRCFRVFQHDLYGQIVKES